MNYMLILANLDGAFRNWQYPFTQAGSKDYVIAVGRGIVQVDRLLQLYEGDIQLWKCDEVDEKIAKELICTFNLNHKRSIIGGE